MTASLPPSPCTLRQCSCITLALLCRSCLWKIPNVPCLIANAICRVLKEALMFLLKIVDAIICAFCCPRPAHANLCVCVCVCVCVLVLVGGWLETQFFLLVLFLDLPRLTLCLLLLLLVLLVLLLVLLVLLPPQLI